MSFLKKLFGIGGSDAVASAQGPGTAEVSGHEDYKGFSIEARPYRVEGGQLQLCGVLSKTTDGTRREHVYVRADRFGSIDDATSITLMKGRQMIDQMGDGVFQS